MLSQQRQDIFGRTCRVERNDPGTYSSTSVTSSPRRRNAPPHFGQAQAGACSTTSRGRFSGNGLRLGLRRRG